MLGSMAKTQLGTRFEMFLVFVLTAPAVAAVVAAMSEMIVGRLIGEILDWIPDSCIPSQPHLRRHSRTRHPVRDTEIQHRSPRQFCIVMAD
jgi:hypothetical protein